MNLRSLVVAADVVFGLLFVAVSELGEERGAGSGRAVLNGSHQAVVAAAGAARAARAARAAGTTRPVSAPRRRAVRSIVAVAPAVYRVEPVEDRLRLLRVVVVDRGLRERERLFLVHLREGVVRGGTDAGRVEFAHVDGGRVAVLVARARRVEVGEHGPQRRDSDECERPSGGVDRGRSRWVDAETRTGFEEAPVAVGESEEIVEAGPSAVLVEGVHEPAAEDGRAAHDVPVVAGRAEHVDAVGAPLGRDDELREVEAESVQDDERECPHQLGERVRRGEHGAEDEDGDDRVAPLVAERLVLDDARVGEPGDERASVRQVRTKARGRR